MAGMYGVSKVDEITPHLYLTSIYGATRDAINKKGITLLVNAAQELPKVELAGVESIKLFLDDTPYALINVYFDRIADKIHENSVRGGRSLIHCVLGVSRSTSLVMAYLMKYKNMSLKNSYDYIVARRPCVRPNPGFWKQLQDFEKKLETASYSKAVTSSHNLSNNPVDLYKNSTPIPITIVSSSSSSLTPRKSFATALTHLSSKYNDLDVSPRPLSSHYSPRASHDYNTPLAYGSGGHGQSLSTSATKSMGNFSKLYNKNVNNLRSNNKYDVYLDNNGYSSPYGVVGASGGIPSTATSAPMYTYTVVPAGGAQSTRSSNNLYDTGDNEFSPRNSSTSQKPYATTYNSAYNQNNRSNYGISRY